MILDEIVADKRKRLEEHKLHISAGKMQTAARACKSAGVSFRDALAKDGLSIIGEFKKASPSLGVIANRLDLTERIGQYNASMDAISCLTEEDHFYGSTEYLEQIRDMSSLPILRKDFIIDPYQIYEAKVIGADAVLLIAAILKDSELAEYLRLAAELGLGSLLEVHDEGEMERALRLGAEIIGVNNRNLKDFTISLDTTRRLAAMMDEDRILVSESGVTDLEDICFLRECHVDALLVGRAFMESENPGKLAQKWKQVYQGW